MMERIRREPVLLVSVIEAALALVVAFGFNLSGEQVATIVAAFTAVTGLWARSRVSPV